MSLHPHLDAFLAAADYFMGIEEDPYGSNRFTSAKAKEMLALAGYGQGGSWCAIFVSACAQKAGIAGKLIFKNDGAGPVTGRSVDYYNATWIPGPYFTREAVTPMPGDLFTIVGSTPYYSGYEHAGHIGIVEYVDDDGVHTLEGNTGTQNSKRCVRNISSTSINGYCRPDWAAVGDIVDGQFGFGPLYQTRNDRHDMTLRQVGYLDRNFALSNISSNIGLSVINYTSVLGDIYDVFAQANSPTGAQVNTSQLSGNIKIAVDYYLGLGFSASTASAIVGCLQAYSGINPMYTTAYTSKIYHYGIAAWPYSVVTDINKKLGEDWNSNLSGQLQYLAVDIAINHKALIMEIKTQPLNTTAVDHVVDIFMKEYNKPYATAIYIDEAKKVANEIYDKLIINLYNTLGSLTNLRDIDGNLLSAQYSVSIPSSVSQTGLIDDYTSYSAWFPGNRAVSNHWGAGSPQRKLAELWSKQGYPCDKGIAKIGGYFCVAVRPKFGKCGEVIVVTLAGGAQFAAIICDEKGNDAGSEWGHKKDGGKISLIEWERVKTIKGKVEVSYCGYSDVDSCQLGDWYGKDVLSITNYGKYVDVRWT